MLNRVQTTNILYKIMNIFVKHVRNIIMQLKTLDNNVHYVLKIMNMYITKKNVEYNHVWKQLLNIMF